MMCIWRSDWVMWKKSAIELCKKYHIKKIVCRTPWGELREVYAIKD